MAMMMPKAICQMTAVLNLFQGNSVSRDCSSTSITSVSSAPGITKNHMMALDSMSSFLVMPSTL